MPLRADLLTVISETQPGGISLRYDPVRDKIKEARREELETPQGAWKTEFKTADWGLVVRLAGDAIAQRSKDLQLAVWLVDAQVRRDGFSALGPGFDFLRGLLDGFWESLYPEIEDGDLEERAGPLSWLGLKLEEPLRMLPLAAGGLSWSSYKESLGVGVEADAITPELRKRREQLIGEGKTSGEQWREAVAATSAATGESLRTTLSAALEALDKLEKVCDQRFGNDAPAFSRTRSAIQEVADLVRGFPGGKPTRVAAPPTPAIAAVPVTITPVTLPAPIPAVVIETPRPAPAASFAGDNGSVDPADLADAEQRLAAICRFLRKKDVYDIAPFLILRGLRFGQIRYNGPDKIDASMLEEPPAETRAELKRLAGEERWDDVIATAETAMELPCGRGWLDLQRYTVTALEAKGEWWAFVADAVRTELRGLLTDLPGLVDMMLRDDTPAANPETRQWIREQILTQKPAAAHAEEVSDRPVPAAPAAAAMRQLENKNIGYTKDEPFERAVAEAQASRLSEALVILSRQLAAECSGRGRFLRRVQLAHVLVAGGQHAVALPILDELASEIQGRSLDTWEDADALAYPLSLLLECLDATGTREQDRAAIHARICRLDPARAIALRA